MSYTSSGLASCEVLYFMIIQLFLPATYGALIASGLSKEVQKQLRNERSLRFSVFDQNGRQTDRQTLAFVSFNLERFFGSLMTSYSLFLAVKYTTPIRAISFMLMIDAAIVCPLDVHTTFT